MLRTTAIALALSVNPALGAAPSALFHGNGLVTVNGSEVNRSTTVFAGDHVQTSEGAGTISLTGTSVLLHRSSHVIFHPDVVEVLAGGATVQTTHAFAARVFGLSVKPNGAASRFTIERGGNKVSVDALEGSIAVGPELTVPAGKSVVLELAADDAQVTSCIDGKKVDENGRFLLDNIGRYVPCHEDRRSAGTVAAKVAGWKIAAAASAAAAAGGITAIVISQNNKTDK